MIQSVHHHSNRHPHARIQIVSSGGQVYFLSLQLILHFYRGGPKVYFKEKYNFLRFHGVSNIFQDGGSSFFQAGGGGSNFNFYGNLSNL